MRAELQPDFLLSAYAAGYFPMDEDGELLWFSPDPRTILPLDEFHISSTLRQTLRQGKFEIRVNAAFGDVIRQCGELRPRTWISDEIIEAYTELHQIGFAHSVEAWRDGILAGGLYGVAIRGAFFGESMFHLQRDASKVALAGLVHRMQARGFTLLDVQWQTSHLAKFGARPIRRTRYLKLLSQALECDVSFVAPPSAHGNT